MFHFSSMSTMLFGTICSELSQFVTALTQLAVALALLFFFGHRFLKDSNPFPAEREPVRPLVGTTCAPIVLMRAEIQKMKAHTRLLEADLTKIEKMHEDVEKANEEEATYYETLAKSFEDVHLLHMESNEEFYMDLVRALSLQLSQTQNQITAAERADRQRAIRTMLHDLYRSQNRLILQEEVQIDNRLLLDSFIMRDRKQHKTHRLLVASQTAMRAHTVRLTAQLAEMPLQQ